MSEHPHCFFSWNQTNQRGLAKRATHGDTSTEEKKKKTKREKKSGGGKAHQVRVIAVINTDSLFNALGKQVTD